MVSWVTSGQIQKGGTTAWFAVSACGTQKSTGAKARQCLHRSGCSRMKNIRFEHNESRITVVTLGLCNGYDDVPKGIDTKFQVTDSGDLNIGSSLSPTNHFHDCGCRFFLFIVIQVLVGLGK